MNQFSLCSKCRKNPAQIFIASSDGQSTGTKGLCLKCAADLGINDIMSYMNGMSDEDRENIENQFSQLMGDMSPEDFGDGENPFSIFTSGDDQSLGELFGSHMNGESDSQALSALNGDNEKKQDNNSGDKSGSKEKGRDGSIPIFNQMMQSFQNSFGGLNSSFGETAEKGGTSSKGKKNKKEKRKFLESYCTDLTEKARNGEIDLIVGREREIYRAVQILNRRTKNNPCLIGEPGVGKTAVAEGIAINIASGKVPSKLKGKELHQLDLTALVAGTQFRGQFESRVKGLLEEVKKAGNIILFIDEVHNLVGAGESEGAMSAANIFKPALSRGEIQVIGATTFTEYRKYIEKDTALERRFQPITVEEPSIESSVDIIMGIKGYYEDYHRVKVPDNMVRDLVILSERYINDRFLPDKAIDLLDEVCSCRSLESEVLEQYDDTLERKQLLLEDIESMETAIDRDYEQIAHQKAELLKLDTEISQLKTKVDSIEITDEDIAKVIELWTGISSAKIRKSDMDKVATIEKQLKKRIIGQDEACELVAAAIRRSSLQVSARKRPASFIFVGPTAVGKTELVKVLADELFDTPDPLIRLDMSEYMEQYSISKIIGSSPGYVGYDEAGQLTEKVRRKPYSVVLFDEIEKAHPNVLNVLLQILDEGFLTDSHGRKVSFKNTVIVMTSNAGSQFKDVSMGFNKSAQDISREKVMKSLNEFLRPEFISRVDEIVVFDPLTEENYAGIAALMLEELKEPLDEKGIKFGYDYESCKIIAAQAFGKKTGAREIRRIIRKEVEDVVTGILIDAGEDYPGIIKLVAEDGKLKVLTV